MKKQQQKQRPNGLQKGKQNPQKKKGNPGKSGMSKDLGLLRKAQKAPFLNALCHPFDPEVLGIQVPDPFPFPTQTYHLHQTTVIGPPISSSITSGAVLFLPNPVFSLVDLQHLNGLTSSNISITTTPMIQFNANNTLASSCYYGACAPASLSAILSTYRVVSWGIKISNLQPELSATGRLIVALVPLGDTIPSYYNLTAQVAATGFIPVTGLSAAVLNSSSTLELPTAVELTVGDLLHGDLEISGMYTNSTFWSFKSTTLVSNPSSGTGSGDDIAYNSLGVVTSGGFKDDTRCVGGSAIIVYYEGIPSTAQNAFQIETIYHLEGSPQLSSAVNSIPVPSQLPKPHVGSVVAVESSMAVANDPKNVFTFIKEGAHFLDDHKVEIVMAAGAVARFATYAQAAFA
jgi:hypothetical protein